MPRKHHIVQLDGRRQPIIPRRILVSNHRAVFERDIADKVCKEAEYVYRWKVDGCARCALPREVEQGLWIEREGPGEGVDPAEGVGEEAEEGECHDCIVEFECICIRGCCRGFEVRG